MPGQRTERATLRWGASQSEAIQSWRDAAPRPPTFRREDAFRAEDPREEVWREARPYRSGSRRPTTQHQQARSSNRTPPLRSSSVGSSGSSSGDERGGSKKVQDIGHNLKYLIRRFLRVSHSHSHLPSSPSSSPSLQKEATENESFVPSPKVTFLIDEPQNLICQICQQTNLRIALTASESGSDESNDGEIPALLACGHIACKSCLDSWLEHNDSCPFCRILLRHTAAPSCCQHKVQPRLIAHDTIHSLPPTLPNGGKIGDRCHACLEKDHKKITLERMVEGAEKFRRAREKADRSGEKEDVEELRKVQRDWERLPEDLLWVLTRAKARQCLSFCLHPWPV
ncbi:hypothetical protein F5Y16DRAFT_134651 [Xylariaceae sp. FL0255]|nr:hypothetical protein F5Y16DRAFT_134651 [Xylariaceae sp. FL0255]